MGIQVRHNTTGKSIDTALEDEDGSNLTQDGLVPLESKEQRESNEAKEAGRLRAIKQP
jgi:hypothetical protein